MQKFPVVNNKPGFTSTKIALYDNEKPVLNGNKALILRNFLFQSIIDQFSYRKELILKVLNDNDLA